MISRALFIFVALLVLASCMRDPLEEAAWQASRVGTAAGAGRGAGDRAGLEAGARIVERFYAVQKYQASREQRVAAEVIARRVKSDRPAPVSGGKASRYIAVRTPSDKRAKTATTVAIWDTQSQQMVGNNVYDLNETPPTGVVLRFETYSAQYVGAGG